MFFLLDEKEPKSQEKTMLPRALFIHSLRRPAVFLGHCFYEISLVVYYTKFHDAVENINKTTYIYCFQRAPSVIAMTATEALASERYVPLPAVAVSQRENYLRGTKRFGYFCAPKVTREGKEYFSFFKCIYL